MNAPDHRFFRHPRTANEKRHNAGFARERFADGVAVKGRVRGRKTRSRLADVRDDRVPAARRDFSRGKATHSLARKAAERRVPPQAAPGRLHFSSGWRATSRFCHIVSVHRIAITLV